METKEWQRFYETGRIEDYLRYKNRMDGIATKRERNGQKEERVAGNAGFCDRDRDDFAGASHGRI